MAGRRVETAGLSPKSSSPLSPRGGVEGSLPSPISPGRARVTDAFRKTSLHGTDSTVLDGNRIVRSPGSSAAYSNLVASQLGISPYALLSSVTEPKEDHVETTCVIANNGDQKPYKMLVLHTQWAFTIKITAGQFFLERTKKKQDLYLSIPTRESAVAYLRNELKTQFEPKEDGTYRIASTMELAETLGVGHLLADQFKERGIQALKLETAIEGDKLVLSNEHQLFKAVFRVGQKSMELFLPPMDSFLLILDFLKDQKGVGQITNHGNYLTIQLSDLAAVKQMVDLFKGNCKEEDHPEMDKFLNAPKAHRLSQIVAALNQGHIPGDYLWNKVTFTTIGIEKGPSLTLNAPIGDNLRKVKLELLQRSASGRHYYLMTVSLPKTEWMNPIQAKDDADPSIEVDSLGNLSIRTRDLNALQKTALYFLGNDSQDLVRNFIQQCQA